jgi:glycine/D-amino acid oxidase-like deaminating enzyme
MLARCVRYVPALAGLPVLRVWVGFRPATPDKLPYIGRAGEAGPWVAAGHEGLGITLAPGTARLLADLIFGRPPLVDPAPYDPLRPLPAPAAEGTA